MKKILLCFLIASALAGCGRDFGAPLASGEVVTFVNRQEATREALSPEQLRALSTWFEQHRSGWYGLITPASSEPTEMQLSLKHTDGKQTVVRDILQANGERYLLLTSSGKWAYQSASGAFKSWAAARRLSDQELTTLKNLLHGKSDKVVAPSERQ